MKFGNFLTGLFVDDLTKVPNLVFGKKRTKDEQMVFMMDASTVNPKGFSTNWGDRFLDPEDRKKTRSARGRRKNNSSKLHQKNVAAQQAAGMESASFRKRRRLGVLDMDELQRLDELEIATPKEAAMFYKMKEIAT